LAYLLGLIVLFQVAPAGTFEAPTGAPESLSIGVGLSMPLGFALLYLVAVCAHGDQVRLEARESGYPRRAFTLPVSSAALARWPLVLGATATALLWLALAGLVWRPCGVAAPLLWPAVFLAGFLSWLQALVWWPFPLPFLRIAVTVPVLGGLATGAVVSYVHEVPEAILLAASVGLIGTGHVLAVAGVARARRGDGTVWREAVVPLRTTERLPRRPFASASQALFWMAWRRGGFTLPLMAGLLTLTHLILLFFVRDTAGASFVIGPLLCPLLFASGAGAALVAWGMGVPPDLRLPAFVAVRPVLTAAFLAALLRVAFVSTLTAWALVLLPLLAALPFTHAGEALRRGFDTLVTSQGVKAWVLLALGGVGLPALTWRQMTSGFWAAMTGRRWFVYTMSIATAVGYTVLLVFGGWVYATPTAHAPLQAAAPWALGVVLTLKLLAGARVVWALRRRRLVRDRTLARLGVAWVAAATGIVALSWWLTPPEMLSPWAVAGVAVIVLLPLVRLGLAVLTLDWNRHR